MEQFLAGRLLKLEEFEEWFRHGIPFVLLVELTDILLHKLFVDVGAVQVQLYGWSVASLVDGYPVHIRKPLGSLNFFH